MSQQSQPEMGVDYWFHQDPTAPDDEMIPVSLQYANELDFQEQYMGEVTIALGEETYIIDLGLETMTSHSGEEFAIAKRNVPVVWHFSTNPLDKPEKGKWTCLSQRLSELLDQQYHAALAAKQPEVTLPLVGKQFKVNFQQLLAVDTADTSNVMKLHRLPVHTWPKTAPPQPTTTTTTTTTTPTAFTGFSTTTTTTQQHGKTKKKALTSHGMTDFDDDLSNDYVQSYEDSFFNQNFADIQIQADDDEEEFGRNPRSYRQLSYDKDYMNPAIYPPYSKKTYAGDKNHALVSAPRPLKHEFDLDSLIYNEMLRLPVADGPFPTLKFDAFRIASFPSSRMYFSNCTYAKRKDVETKNAQFLKGEQLECPLCLTPFIEEDENDGTTSFMDESVLLPECGHMIHVECLKQSFNEENRSTTCCPVCRVQYFPAPGHQPVNGTCTISYDTSPCNGFSKYGSIMVDYSFPSGVTDDRHDSVGVPYSGDGRQQILPADPFSLKVVLKLFLKAFFFHQVVVIGYSPGRNQDNVITYGPFHFKTSHGPGEHGFNNDGTYPRTTLEEFAGAHLTLTPDEFDIH